MSDEFKRRPGEIHVAPAGMATASVRQDLPEPRPDPRRESNRNAVPGIPGVVPATGQSALTADGHEIGRISEVSRSHVKVSVSMRPDYWIDADDIAEASAERVVFKFPRAEIDAHTLKNPAPADTLLPAEKQLAQRRQMEAELARQHDELPDDVPHSPYHVRNEQ